jgi:uncharacterized membrane protein
MKKSITIFETHDEAVKALVELRESGVNMQKISLVGKAEIVDDQIHVKSNKPLIAAPIAVGTVAGTTLGLLTGIGLFAIPGLGVLFGAGAVIGALAGFEIGVAAGGLTTILVELGVKEDHITYEQHVHEGRFLLFFDGTEEEIHRVEQLVSGLHLGTARH